MLLLRLGLLFPAVLAGCDPAAGGAPAGGAAGASATAPAPVADTVPDSAFAALVEALSEPGAYFDTDNLISNESSYLHVVGALEERGVRGGAYVGVGPGQNFSYIAAVRPELAFLVDIRRDNLLQHLWYKALFEASPTRLDFLCLMVARRCGAGGGGVAALDVGTLDVEALVDRVERAAPVADADALIDRVLRVVEEPGVPLSAEDRATVRSIHARFAAEGLGLRFRTHGRGPRPEYPTLRRLLLERDERNRRSGYLATEEAYRAVRSLQRRNRVIPVVGDLSGPHAVRAIGREVGRRGLVVSAFYASNVEYYLFRQGGFDAWVENLRALPASGASVIIRSYFNRFRPHPETRPGYASTQLVEPVSAFLERWDDGRIPRYEALVRDRVTVP